MAVPMGEITRALVGVRRRLATIRSREISACLVLQAQSQLKAIYKDNADTIIGNMDSRIFLGGSEPTTLKELNQALGKETIDTYNTSNTRGNSPSYGLNYQKLGKDLASVDELAVLDGSKCILQLRGVRPFLSDKYDLTQHPNYKYTSDFDKRNEFNIEQFLSRRLKLKAGDEFVVVDAATWSSDADGHWHECSLCHDKKDNAAHTPGAAATETTPQKCTECDYIITPALGHTHHMTPVAANPATCTEDGNKAYYVCSGCSKWFEDATGSVEITDHSSVVIGKLGHDWVDATCTTPKACSRCDATEGTPLGHDFADVWSSDASGHWHACSRCDAKDGEAAHTPDREAATETDPIKCTECDYIITAALGHTHSLTKVEANAPTCTEDGNIEYYTCSGCSKLFADATGNVEITADKTVDKATGHQYEWVIDKEATATEKGSKHEECKVCHDKKAAVEIPATGTPTDPQSPQTGDNSMMGLWIALLFVSGAGVVGTTVYGRKKKYSVK